MSRISQAGEAAASPAPIEDAREIKNDRERHAAIARDYARLPEEERSRTIVVAGTNEARREINSAIREDLGLAGQGREYSILIRRDTTQAERAFAKNCAPGEIVQPERDYPRLGLERARSILSLRFQIKQAVDLSTGGPAHVIEARLLGLDQLWDAF